MSDHTAALPELEPQPRRRQSRGLVAVIASVLAVVLIAGGGFAAWQFLSSSGTRPAEVLPASTFALVAVDLDPSGGQKIEAIKTLRKFPSWRERTGITSDSDVVKALFEKTLGRDECSELDYDADLAPWIGQRAAVGGVTLGDDKPAPVLALQVKDEDKARAGFAELAKCSGAADDDDFGWTLAADYVVVSDSVAHAEAIVAAGEKSPLSESAAFQKWTEEAGGAGIMNVFIGPDAATALSDAFGSELEGLTGPGAALTGFEASAPSSPEPDPGGEVEKALEDFEGAAATLKFNDGGIELSFAGGGAQVAGKKTVAEHVGSLPEDTAAVVAFAVPEDAKARLTEQGGTMSELLKSTLGAGLGLDVPDDLITLLGDSMSISVGGDAPADLDDVAEPADIPAGVLVHGDEQQIRSVITKVEARTGTTLADLPAALSSGDGKVALATSPAYADQLVEQGSLADSETFKDVVTHLDDAPGIAYVSFDNDWLDALRATARKSKDADADEVVANVERLQALGMSVWSEGETSHGLLRISVK